MLVDLHCHTKKVKKGEGIERNVTSDLFREKIELSDVKVVAITNHNSFDINQYYQLKDAVKDICHVWPGVELDTEGALSENRFHLIVVCNPDDVSAFEGHVNNLFYGKDVNSCVHTIEEICSEFCQCDVIYIAHYHNKRPAISSEDRLKLIELVGDSARIFVEPRDHRTLGVLANKNLSVMIGSDVKDWSKYEKSTFAELRLPIGSFSEFILLAKRDTEVVKTLMGHKTSRQMIGKPHSTVEVLLDIYPDINIIFGPKGTGKTEILESLYDEMVKEGKKCKKYVASERGKDFDSLLSTGSVEVDLSKVNADLCEREFQFLKEWSDNSPTLFSTYTEWASTKNNSNNKSRMKITDAIHETYTPEFRADDHKKDNSAIASIEQQLENITLEEYLSNREKDDLLRMIGALRSSIRKKRIQDLSNEKAVDLVNYSIDKIKSLADSSSDTVSRPSTAGLFDFANGRLTLLKNTSKLLSALMCRETNETEFLGTLEDKGKIYINTRYRMLCTESRTEEFGKHGIRALRDIVRALEDIREGIFSEDVSSKIDRFNELCSENDVTTLKPFLGISKQIVGEDGIEYEPSNGEKGILLLQKMLQEDADAFFLDEPELGMGSAYIDNDIRPKIISLAKQRKYVVVATHNANIAVRTLPYMSIYRIHTNGVYKTYVGNPFDDRLVNISDSSDVLSWTEESMHCLEGGKEAFYERRDIYESKDN